MKTALFSLVLFAAAAALLAVTGCSSTPVETRQNASTVAYPPTDPAAVQILHQTPEQPNVKLGEITVQQQSTNTPASEIEAKLQEAAAKMGANAVVIVQDKTEVTRDLMKGGAYSAQLVPETGRVIVGVPIRYTAPAAVGGSEAP